MALFENFPYTNMHNLNLDWIIKTFLNLDQKLDRVIAGKIKVADPLQWDITSQYEEFTIVYNLGKAYISLKPVPAGVSLANSDYWLQLFDLDAVFASFKDSVSFHDDGASSTSTENRAINSLVWLNDTLYKVIAPINIYDTYNAENVVPVSIEEWVGAFITAINTRISAAETRIDTAENNIEDLEERKTAARNFILIGDSFGGGVDGDDNAHSVPGGGWIQRFKDAVSGWANVYNNQVPLGGVYGFASSRPFLDVLQNAESYITDKTTITDIVVLGGTNDIPQSAADIRTAIETFVAYCHTNYPQARIAIGCLGTDTRNMVAMGKIYSSCVEHGAEYIADLRALYCLQKYIGLDGIHLTASGYAFYTPYINQAILTGYSDWMFTHSGTDALTLNSSVFTARTVRFEWVIGNKTYCCGITGYEPGEDGIITLNKTLDAGEYPTALLGHQEALRIPEAYTRIQALISADGDIIEAYPSASNYRSINVVIPLGIAPKTFKTGFSLARPMMY